MSPFHISIRQSLRIRASLEAKRQLADEIRYRTLAIRFPRLAHYYMGLIG